jgi:hypothetical protein
MTVLVGKHKKRMKNFGVMTHGLRTTVRHRKTKATMWKRKPRSVRLTSSILILMILKNRRTMKIRRQQSWS